MTNRAERLGLEPGSIEAAPNNEWPPRKTEIAHSIAISLKRIADVLLRAEELAAAEVRGPNRSHQP